MNCDSLINRLHHLIAIFLLVSLLPCVWAGEVYTVAGNGDKGYSGNLISPLEAELAEPFGIVRGPDGLMYFCEFNGHVIRRINANGQLEIIAGTPGLPGYTGDGGSAVDATLNLPHEIRFDTRGNLFVSDMANHVIRKIDKATQRIETIAGTGKKGFSGDGGPGVHAQLNDPISIQFDSDSNLWICDIGNHRLRVIDFKTGRIRTVCGNGEKDSFGAQGLLSPSTPLKGPRTIDFDASGTGWLALREGNQVYRIEVPEQRLVLVAGTGESGDQGDDGPAIEAKLNGPKGISVSKDGKSVYLADTENHVIRRIDVANGTIHHVVGTGQKHDGPDGPASECSLARPHGVFLDSDGTLYIGDSENHRIRALRPN
jgi:DNA-binding beta-propeller fold protein YncE